MNTIVFILGSYIPKLSATSNCAHQIIEKLKKNNENKVIIIAEKTSLEDKEYEDFEGCKIFRVSTKLMNEELKESNRILNKLYIKIKRNLKIIFNKRTIDEELVEKYMEKLAQIEKISILIPIVYPFESLVASVSFKEKTKKKIKIVPIIFDNFIESTTIHRFKINKIIKNKIHEKLENVLLSKSYKIIFMNHFKEYVMKFREKTFYNRIIFMEHPLLEDRCKSVDILETNEINICFAGTLTKGYVDPRKVLDILIYVVNYNNPKKIKFKFYNRGNCSKYIDQLKSEKILNCGNVKTGELKKIYDEMNIFFNIGEKKGKQISSKVFEYISYGKPIIHFSFSDIDLTENILKKYELSLIVKMNDEIEENALKIYDFINKNYNKTLKFKNIYKEYFEADPNNFKILIENLIKRDEK